MNRRFVTASAAFAAWGLAAPALLRAEDKHDPIRELWYRQAAHDVGAPAPVGGWTNTPGWTEGLAIGNGRIGGVVFGGVDHDRVQLNESSLWSGEAFTPAPRDGGKDPAAVLGEVRRLLFAGRHADGEALMRSAMLPADGAEFWDRFGSYQTLGDLRLTFDGSGDVTDYERSLSLERGVATVRYSRGGTKFTREYFVSRPDQVVVIRVTSDKAKQVGFSLRMDRPMSEGAALTSEAQSPDQVVLRGHSTGRGGVEFIARARVKADGGKVTAAGGCVRVESAQNVMIVLSAGTDLWDGDFEQQTLDDVNWAWSKSFDELRTRHGNDVPTLFNRVALELPATEASALATDERLAAAREGKTDPALAALAFQYGRYLLLSSSRPGGLAANLQGLWCESLTAAWQGDWHLNINAEMNYWPAEVTGLAECHEPLLELAESLREPGGEMARRVFGCRGWTAGWATNAWGFAGLGTDPVWGFFPASNAWLCSHLWAHYEFGGAAKVLDRIYPTIADAADFWADFLVEDRASGKLVACPSASAENQFRSRSAGATSIGVGSTIDITLARELFAHAIDAATRLDTDGERRARWTAARDRLADLKIDPRGRLQEWQGDVEEVEPGHRHLSHLYGLYPGQEITPEGTPALAKAARVALEHRLEHGGGSTGWSRAWVAALYARLHDGEAAGAHVREWLARFALPNLWGTHPPFQIDGNLGLTAAIAELLVQSRAEGDTTLIDLLPALPPEWGEGAVRGLRTRGGYVVDVTWRGGRIRNARVSDSVLRDLTVALDTEKLRDVSEKGNLPGVRLRVKRSERNDRLNVEIAEGVQAVR